MLFSLLIIAILLLLYFAIIDILLFSSMTSSWTLCYFANSAICISLFVLFCYFYYFAILLFCFSAFLLFCYAILLYIFFDKGRKKDRAKLGLGHFG